MAGVSHELTEVRHHGKSAQIVQILLPACFALMLGVASRLLILENNIRFKMRREPQ